jgi:16S rRNA (guanine527-N7)-methyltransferase
MTSDFAQEVAALLLPHLPPGPDRPELAAELGRFCDLLRAANERLNLTRITDARGMALLHVVDTFTALPLLKEARHVADLGSGGGVPGIPLALARPDLRVTLLESRGRKAAALEAIAGELGLHSRVRAVASRGEAWLAEHRADTIVARAVGRTPDVLELLSPVRRGFRRLVLMKGPTVDAELADLTPRRLAALGFGQPRRVEATLPGGERRVLLSFTPR